MTLMPIGRFAKASRLSVRSLRNYDDAGLLPAAFVDPGSGYRYYRVEQLARASVIRTLRSLDVGLPAIAEFFAAEDPGAVLAAHLVELEARRDQLDRTIDRVIHLLQTKGLAMDTRIAVKDISAQRVAAFRCSATQTEIFQAIPDGFGKVFAILGDVTPTGIPFVLFHTFPDAETAGEVSMCVPIDRHRTIDSGDDVEVLDLPASAMVAIVHRGSYEEMGEAYASIASWIHARGHAILGPSREIYLNSPTDVDQDDLLTEIQWPIDRASLDAVPPES
jgi:effector-binding domain-containing protein